MGDADIGNTVTEMISMDKVVLFSKTTCPYCTEAKNLFKSIGCSFKSYELDQMGDGPKIQDYLGQLTGARTVKMGDADIGNTVTEMISMDKVVLFSKTTCPYCTEAKNLFKSIGCSFKSYELDQMGDGPKIQDYLGQLTGARTVPRVFVKGNCIGGASDTVQLHKKGALEPLLA